jgi:hypothetical protein
VWVQAETAINRRGHGHFNIAEILLSVTFGVYYLLYFVRHGTKGTVKLKAKYQLVPKLQDLGICYIHCYKVHPLYVGLLSSNYISISVNSVTNFENNYRKICRPQLLLNFPVWSQICCISYRFPLINYNMWTRVGC